jgi:hypothetical protein
MPSGRNWLVFVYINLAFVILISSVYGLLTINNLMNNWSEYRCDAMLMPFAGLIMQPTLPPNITPSQYTKSNFQYCTQNVMSNSMGDFLQPLEYNNQLASTSATNTSNSLNTSRQNSTNARNSLGSITSSFGSLFKNISANTSTIHGYTGSIVGKANTIGTASSNAAQSTVNASLDMKKSV